MSNLKASDVERALTSTLEEDGGYFYWGELEWYARSHTELVVNGESYPFTVVESNEGSEGDYDVRTYVVVKVGDQHFKKTGHYMSHYGNDWDGPFVEVKAVPVERFEWREV